MMERLTARAEAIARTAQSRRLEQIAGGFRRQGLRVEMGADSIVVSARRLVRRWLGDPLLRFAGRAGA